MKKLLSLLITLSLILSYSVFSFADVNKPVFSDVDFNTDVGKDIQKLLEAGIINGNGDGTFTPNNPVTRAELCKMVNNLRGYTAVSETGFSDVTSDKWYYTHVLIGKQAGYINGFPDGTFRGDEYITREQVCAIICRAFGIYDLGLSAGITDEVSDWALPYVNALVTNKLITLEDGNTFRATQNMKRGELSTSLSKFVVSAPSGSGTVSGGTTGGTSSGGSFSGGSWGGSTGGGTSVAPTPTDPETPGGSTGGNEGGNTGSGTTTPTDPETPGGNTGGSTGGNEGGNTGSGTTTPADPETPGGNTGGSTGGNEGGNTGSGTTTPDTPEDKPDEMTKEEIIAANEEVVSYLESVNKSLKLGAFTGNQFKALVQTVKNCISQTVTIGKSGEELITKDYVNIRFKTEIDGAKKTYYDWSDETQATFINQVENAVKDEEAKAYLLAMFA